MDRRGLLTVGPTTAALAISGAVASAAPGAEAQGALPDAVLARSLSGDFHSRYADITGTRLHYVADGKGSPIALLPGWLQTWWRSAAVDVQVRKIENTGHYLTEEQPDAIVAELRKFLG